MFMSIPHRSRFHMQSRCCFANLLKMSVCKIRQAFVESFPAHPKILMEGSNETPSSIHVRIIHMLEYIT